MKTASIILAAGQGTRMRSKLPKVMHTILGKPLIWHAIKVVKKLSDLDPVVVVGHGADLVRQSVADQAQFALQAEQLGTGHAVMMAESALSGKADLILITFADMPLLRAETLEALIRLHQSGTAPLTMTSVVGDVPRGFGRILRDADGKVKAIIEEALATPEQLAIREYNVSAYCIDAAWLWASLPKIQVSPKGEYYLTDLVEIAVKEGHKVKSLIVEDPSEAMGVNNRLHLAEAEAILRQRINTAWMLAGVSLVDPLTTYIEQGVRIGQDTTIWPNTILQGKTVIGEDCVIGPNTVMRDTKVGDRSSVVASDTDQAIIGNDVSMGPYCRLRKGAVLEDHVHMGNFGEVKDSHLGQGVKMGHFSYIGNAIIGANVNIGAGTITCNYDGEKKNVTEIGENTFIGSDTMLVAPLKIGKNAITGAGSVVTKDVPDDTLVLGVPARPKFKVEKSE